MPSPSPSSSPAAAGAGTGAGAGTTTAAATTASAAVPAAPPPPPRAAAPFVAPIGWYVFGFMSCPPSPIFILAVACGLMFAFSMAQAASAEQPYLLRKPTRLHMCTSYIMRITPLS